MIKFEKPWVIEEDGEESILKFSPPLLDELGTITFLDLPNRGALLTDGMPCISLEATNWLGTCKMPVSGKVVDVNDQIAGLNSQQLTSQDWILKLKK